MTTATAAQAASPSVLELRPYQLAAAEAIREGACRGRRRMLVQLATGLGKTVLFAELARRFLARGQRVLVIAHRDELLTQARDKLLLGRLSQSCEALAQSRCSGISLVYTFYQERQSYYLGCIDVTVADGHVRQPTPPPGRDADPGARPADCYFGISEIEQEPAVGTHSVRISVTCDH